MAESNTYGMINVIIQSKKAVHAEHIANVVTEVSDLARKLADNVSTDEEVNKFLDFALLGALVSDETLRGGSVG